MNFKPLLQKLESSAVFENFKEKNPDTFLCAGFFILDFKENRKEYTLDYKLEEKIATFSVSEDSDLVTLKGEEEILDKTKPISELNSNINIEIEKLMSIVEKELEKNKVKNKIEKIIAILQQKESPIWNLTCMLQGLKIIIIHINALTGEISKFENKSLFDFVKPSK